MKNPKILNKLEEASTLKRSEYMYKQDFINFKKLLEKKNITEDKLQNIITINNTEENRENLSTNINLVMYENIPKINISKILLTDLEEKKKNSNIELESKININFSPQISTNKIDLNKKSIKKNNPIKKTIKSKIKNNNSNYDNDLFRNYSNKSLCRIDKENYQINNLKKIKSKLNYY